MKSYFEGYKLKSLLAIILKFLEACFELMLPLLMVSLINDGILMRDQAHVYKISLMMILLTGFGYLASITCQYYASVIAQKVGGRIRMDLMETILKMPKSVRDDFDGSTLIVRSSSDIDRIIDMIAKTIRLAVRAPMIILGSVGAMYILNPQLSFILLLSIPIFVITIGLFMMLSVRYHTAIQSTWDHFTFKMKEYLSGIRVIFAFNKAQEESQNLNEINNELSNKVGYMAFLNSISGPLVALMMNALLILLVYLGAIQVQQGLMVSTQILALINYCTQIVLTLIVFMNLVMIFSRGLGSWKRVNAILSIGIHKESKEAVSLNDVETLTLVNVSFSYPNESRKVLDNINISLKQGDRLGIIGLTGSGKSTLLKVIAGLYQVDDGVITLNQRSMNEYKVKDLRKEMGYIAQKPEFLSGKLSEMVSLDDAIDSEYYLNQAQGQDLIAKGMSAPVYKNASNLSGGQKQRLSIAAQLAKNPSVLLFDDSFSALDSITTKNLRERIDSNYPLMTQIIASQRTSAVAHADHIIVLEQGRISDQGTHDSLLKTSALYQEIWQLDAHGENL